MREIYVPLFTLVSVLPFLPPDEYTDIAGKVVTSNTLTNILSSAPISHPALQHLVQSDLLIRSLHKS